MITTALETEVPGYRRNYHRYGTHELVLGMVPAGAKVLDAGCASGYLGAELAERGAVVWGFDRDESAVRSAASSYQSVLRLDLEDKTELPWPEEFFDVVLAADVVEHLRDPAGALRLLAQYVRPGGRLIVSVPNVAHASIRLSLLLGRFTYRDTGILDRTHLRFFTFRSARRFVESAGLRIESVQAASDHFGWLLNSRFGPVRALRGLLGYGIVIVARRGSEVEAERSQELDGSDLG